MRSRLTSFFMVGVSLAVGAVAFSWSVQGVAQSDAIRQRQDIFHGFGEAVKEPGAMLRHEAPFDLAVVRASLKVIADGSPKLKVLFPDDSKSGRNTEALPVIWQKKESLLRIFDQLGASAEAASAAIKDDATFRSEWGKVSSNCRECHKIFRALPKM